MGDHLAISGGGFYRPLELSQNRCFAGAARSFTWARTPRAQRNSTTDQNRTKDALLACRRDALNWSSLLTIELNKLCGRPLRGDANTARWL